jgi:hypothetical protein
MAKRELTQDRPMTRPPASVVQNPNVFGTVTDLTKFGDAAHAKGALLVAVFTEIVSLGLITPPGEMGADIVVGEGQSIGNALNFGGPYVGLFATSEKFMRQMPGRLCGETVDADGKRGFVLTLSTREQHIRRDKATSNICTNSGLCALAFTIHMTLLGEQGPPQLADAQPRSGVMTLADTLCKGEGRRSADTRFFNEFAVKLTKPAASRRRRRWRSKGVIGGVPASRLFPDKASDNVILVAAPPNAAYGGRYRSARRRLSKGAGALMMNKQGRPTTGSAGGHAGTRPPISGNRGLLQEKPDLRDRPHRQERRGSAEARRARQNRLGGVTQAAARSACRACPSRRSCATTPASARRTTPSTSASSAGLVHDEAQPAPEREDGAPAGLRRHASAAAAVDRAGRAGADRPAGDWLKTLTNMPAVAEPESRRAWRARGMLAIRPR